METLLLSFIFAMFEKLTRKFASKATDSAVDGVKETLNDKLDTYSGIIKVGLTLAVIIFGSVKINDHLNRRAGAVQTTAYLGLPGAGSEVPQQPIIINNYISDGRHGQYGRQDQNHKRN